VQNVVTYNVVVSADNRELTLLPGMTANLKIVTEQKDHVLQVPNAALRFRPAGADAEPRQGAGAGGRSGAATGPRGSAPRGRVWVAGSDGTPQAVPVQLGISDGTNTEVIGGELKERDLVIIGGPSAGDRPARPAGGGGPRLF